MLALARDATRSLANIEVAQGGSEDLGPRLGVFHSAVIGRAFHWMDPRGKP